MSEPGRAVLVGGGCLLAVPVLVLAAPHLDGLPAGPGALIGWLSSPPVDGHLLTLLALLTWGCVLWLLVGVGVSALSTLPGLAGRCAAVLAGRLAPGLLRRAVRAALGVSLAGAALVGVAGPAGAATCSAVGVVATAPAQTGRAQSSPAQSSPAQSSPAQSAPLQISAPKVRASGQQPDRPWASPTDPTSPTSPVRPAPPAAPRPPVLVPTPYHGQHEPTGDVVVVRGDTLWGLAARRLGPEATSAQVAREWHRWYAANRAVIGSNPDLILPGQRLHPPPG